MKKEYIAPKSRFYSVEFSENIASSIPGSFGGDQISGAMTILFSHTVTPCRDYYTESFSAPVTVPENSTFVEYFLDMQGKAAPTTCLQLI